MVYSYSWFISMARENLEFGCTISHSYLAHQKEFYVLTISDNADSCMEKPYFYLKICRGCHALDHEHYWP